MYVLYDSTPSEDLYIMIVTYLISGGGSCKTQLEPQLLSYPMRFHGCKGKLFGELQLPFALGSVTPRRRERASMMT